MQHLVLTNEAMVILLSCCLVIIIKHVLYYANGVYMVIEYYFVVDIVNFK